MLDLTDQLSRVVAETGISDGLLSVYNPHTTAGVCINEGADPDVQRDILSALDRIVPTDHPYRHAEGNSPAHIMAALTGSSVTIHIQHGRLRLGTWQRLFFCEFDGPRDRRLWWKIIAG
jgi:secondary thiamine-phosphate synthase enzyme